MNWDLPTSVEIDGKNHKIRNDCDYRIILDVISALSDNDLPDVNRIECALFIFYDDVAEIDNFDIAIRRMMEIINCGDEEKKADDKKPKLMDWEKDFKIIAPPISRVLGYSVRDSKNYTHWYDFIGAYLEIGECFFANVVSIRAKKAKGKKLEKHEREFYKENKDIIDLPANLSEEDKEWLYSDF